MVQRYLTTKDERASAQGIWLNGVLSIVASFLFFADLAEQAWFLGSTVMVASLLLHAAAKPYEDALIDWCEFLSLVSTLFVFQSGVVFKVLNDPSNPATSEDARSLADALEWISILLMFGNVVLASIVECRVISHVQVGDEDYRVRLIKQQIEEQKKEAELAEEWLALRKAANDAMAAVGQREFGQWGARSQFQPQRRVVTAANASAASAAPSSTPCRHPAAPASAFTMGVCRCTRCTRFTSKRAIC